MYFEPLGAIYNFKWILHPTKAFLIYHGVWSILNLGDLSLLNYHIISTAEISSRWGGIYSPIHIRGYLVLISN